MPKRWTRALLLGLMLPIGPALGQETAVGEVESVQLLDASQLGGGDRLILVLANGRGFDLPGEPSVALSPGMRVKVQHVPPDTAGELATACIVAVLAVPLERDDERTMQEAARPFVVYRNETAEAGC